MITVRSMKVSFVGCILVRRYYLLRSNDGLGLDKADTGTIDTTGGRGIKSRMSQNLDELGTF